MNINPTPVLATDEITVMDLIHRLYDAKEKMSVTNPHRALILHAMSALMQLSRRLEDIEAQQAEQPRVELVTGAPLQ
jgi:hypothetical protein